MAVSDACFVLPERLTAAEMLAVWPQALAAVEAAGPVCRINAAALQVFDSAALALLLALRRRAAARGAVLVWQAAPQRLQDLAALYGVGALLSEPSAP